MTRHSRDDVLTERQFELLLRACRKLGETAEFEARLALHLCGKLGMRVGEAAHLSSDWINERERMIEIPEYDPCTKSGGDACGYCRSRARSHVDAMDISQERAESMVRDEFDDELEDEMVAELAEKRREKRRVSYEEAIKKWWKPKTGNGARAIPYDWDVRTALMIEEFVEKFDVYPKSQSTLNRRIDEVAEIADLKDNVYPHALRATAASFHAKRSVSPYSLMAIMGWKDIKVARAYIQSSSENAAKEVRSKHR